MASGGRFYFPSDELHSIGAAESAATVAAEIAPGTQGSFPGRFTPLGDALVFAASEGEAGDDEPRFGLFAYDPDPDPDPDPDAVTALPDLPRGPGVQSINAAPTAFGGDLYFTYQNGSGQDLYRYDPAADTLGVADVFDERFGLSPDRFVEADGDLFFNAIVSVREELDFNGTFFITTRGLSKLDAATGEVAPFDDVAMGLTATLRDTVFFTGNRLATGSPLELMAIDPSGDSVRAVVNLTDLGVSRVPSLTAVGDSLYLIAQIGGNTGSYSLYTVSNQGLSAPKAPLLQSIFLPNSNAAAVGGRLFFAYGLLNQGNGVELHVYDPATGVTEQVEDFTPGAGQSTDLRFFTTAGGRLYFTANGQAATFNPDTERVDLITQNLEVDALTVFDGRLLASVRADDAGYELYELRTGLPTSVRPVATTRSVELRVWPNPARDGSTLIVEGADGPALVRLFDTMGREVARLHDGPLALGEKLTVPTGTLASGLYFVTVRTDAGTATQPLTVVR